MQAELERHDKEFRIRIYDGVGHAFFAVDRTTYDVNAAIEGWAEVLDWFAQVLAYRAKAAERADAAAGAGVADG